MENLKVVYILTSMTFSLIMYQSHILCPTTIPTDSVIQSYKIISHHLNKSFTILLSPFMSVPCA
jgi:hypothetical protein